MSISPPGLHDNPVNVSILLNGRESPSSFRSVVVTHTVDAISFARIVVEEEVADCWSSSDEILEDLDPGTNISVKLGFGTNLKTVFEGVITANRLSFDSTGKSISVDCSGILKQRLYKPCSEPVLSISAGVDLMNVDVHYDDQGRTQGTATVKGNGALEVCERLTLCGLGKQFSGTVYITHVEHQVIDGDWNSMFGFDSTPETAIDEKPSVALAAEPEFTGLHYGIVTENCEDPENQFRVRVALPAMGENAMPVWADLSQFHASAESGAVFIPEIGDKVLVGFLEGQASAPVVVGSLYKHESTSLHPLSKGNNIKALVTRSNMKVEFDDDAKRLTISTPKGNKLVLGEDQESVTLSDQHANTVKLNSGGITLDSVADINLISKGNVSISATKNISIKALQDIEAEALKISHTANTAFTAKGTASAELSASGTTTVKGAMVMIN